jgi:GNAT superfamily N-acetyltransferase
MIKFQKKSGDDPDFASLVSHLDAYLAEKDGRDHEFYNQYNGISGINYALVYYFEEKPVACGAIKEFGKDAMEVKRMFTLPEYRGKGIAGELLAELESWAKELGAKRIVLETGKKQVEAVSLYERSGFGRIPNYGQYIGIKTSMCFEKPL